MGRQRTMRPQPARREVEAGEPQPPVQLPVPARRRTRTAAAAAVVRRIDETLHDGERAQR